MKFFPENTEKLVGSGIRYEFDEGGFYVDFLPDQPQVDFGFTDPDFYKFVDPKKAYVKQLTKPVWHISGINLWGLCHRSVYANFGLPKVTDHTDGHQRITREALMATAGIDAYLGEDGFSFSELPLMVSNQDVPALEVSEHANLMSLLHSNIGAPEEQLDRHALRPITVDINNDTITVASQSETQAGIRASMDSHLEAIFDVNTTLANRESLKAFEAGTFTNRLDDLRFLSEALESGDFESALTSLENFRHYSAFGQMRDFVIPDQKRREHLLKNPQFIFELARPHLTLLAMMEKVQAVSDNFCSNPEPSRCEEEAAEMLKAYGTVLQFFRPEFQQELATGRIPALALRDLHLAHTLHLVQDTRAHCNSWENDVDGDGFGDVCTESVGVNLMALGPTHSESNDSLEDQAGAIKADRALTISEELLQLVLIDNHEKFEREKTKFLDKYWPEGFDYPGAPLIFDVNDFLYTANSARKKSRVSISARSGIKTISAGN